MLNRRDMLKGLAALPALSSAFTRTAPVEGLVLSNDAWPRATNLTEWTADVLRIAKVEKAPETAQAKAFFEWLRCFSRMAVGGMIQSSEGAHGKETAVLDGHKQLFVYGWGFCDTTSRIAEAAWQEYKRDPSCAQRVCLEHEGNGGYHTLYRLRLDGHWGAFDGRYGYYLVERDAPDARILDWAEVSGKFPLNKGYRHRSRPFFEIARLEWERALKLRPAFFETEKAWRASGAPKETPFGDPKYEMGTRFHDMTFTLERGMSIERFWDNRARKFYVPATVQREWPFLPAGRFYRVTETSHEGNWPQFDPNYQRAKPYLATVPTGEGYPEELAGGRSIGQAYGVMDYRTVPRIENGEGVVDVRSPYVLVDGTLEAPAAAAVSIRTLAPKTLHAAEADQWSEWQALPGTKGVELGRPRWNGSDVSIHGRYRFQLRVKAAPGVHVSLKLYFENGIMSIPPLFAGSNTMRLRLAEPAALEAPVTVAYRYETEAGEKTHRQVLRAGDFHNGEAMYPIEAPGLVRCRSVAISY